MTEVLMFTTSTCPWCRRAREYLAAKGLYFREVNVERDEETFRQMVETTGRTAVPVLKIEETWLVGFHSPTIERALTRAGLGAQEDSVHERPGRGLRGLRDESQARGQEEPPQNLTNNSVIDGGADWRAL